jgi:hypothetical protein
MPIKNVVEWLLKLFLKRIKMKSASTVVKVVVPITFLSVSVYTLNAQYNKPAYQPVYKSGEMSKDIVSLARLQKPQATLPPTSSLTEWNTYLQRNFLRPPNVDHQEMAQMQQDPKHGQMTLLFNALGMVKDIKPSKKQYDNVFVFGGTPSHTKERFEFLAQNIKSKRIDVPANATVTYINGHRKIASSEVAEAKAMGVDCEYQHQCAELIWKAYYAGLPVKLEVMTIQPPEGRRANTDDTLMAFYARIPADKHANVLGYSNQPYGPYQGDTADAVKQRMKRYDLQVEVVAKASDDPVPTITYLDSIARRVYTAMTLRPN